MELVQTCQNLGQEVPPSPAQESEAEEEDDGEHPEPATRNEGTDN